MSAKNIVLNMNDWNPQEVKYMAPKVNNMGGKSINIISKQTNRAVHISTPLLITWGITDFLDEKTGESDGKFSISLQFPNDDYRNESTDKFLAKLKAFEAQVLEDAVKNSELWWGEHQSMEICKHGFFPFLKYSKIKDTKKIDYSKPPTFRPKVPCYDGKWGLEIYDTNTNLIFPCETNSSQPPKTPMELVPKLSRVACGLQCSGIWIGGKGWGITWKVFQCIVKPMEVAKITGKCHIQLSIDDMKTMDEPVRETSEDTTEVSQLKQTVLTPLVVPPISTKVEDSDDEDESVVEEEAVVEPVVEEVVEPVVVKKILKKIVDEPETPPEQPKKKVVIKKKVV